MSTRSKRMSVLGAVALIPVALPVLAQTAQKAKPKMTTKVTAKTATIENTGSTNTSGYKITLLSTGNTFRVASVSHGGSDHNSEMGNREPLQQHVRKFFTDLDAALPLTDLPARHGMRSASFGTRTFVTYKGQQSPDLTFGGDARATALKADIDAITQALHVGNAPRRPVLMRPLPPQPETN